MKHYQLPGCCTLTVGDCSAWLNTLPSCSADTFFADPPFNIGYQYDEYQDTLPQSKYLDWCRSWLHSAARILKPGGALWVAISDENAAEMAIAAKSIGFQLRNWCVWSYTFGPHLKTKFGRNKAHLLYFVKGKGKPAFFDPPLIRSARQELGDKRANPAGRVPGDVWTEFPRLVGNAHERTDHPCQMPEALLSRILLSTCPRGGLVVDPMAGSGTTLAAGIATGRRVRACELSKQYAAGILERIAGGILEAIPCHSNEFSPGPSSSASRGKRPAGRPPSGNATKA